MTTGGDTMFLRAAVHIGESLCREAYWYEGACNWVSHAETATAEARAPVPARMAALSPDIYGGSAGVALFLAQLWGATRGASFRDTALGAVSHALACAAEDDPSNKPLGFYDGHLGIAWAAVRIGGWLGAAELSRRGLALAETLMDADSEHLLDLLSGSSGAILALLALCRTPGGERFVGDVERLGDELVAAAVAEEDGAWVWDAGRVTVRGMGTHMLTGLSHGAAGIGVALAALHACTGRAIYRTAAVGAFTYEDRWFDEVEENWRDLRPMGADTAPPKAFGSAWCHGAPGTGLARVRASMLIPDCAPAWRRGIESAARTSSASLSRYARDQNLDATPCHGLAGVTEFLIEATRLIPELEFGARAALRTWRRMIAAHGQAARWPSGLVTRAYNPSLMLGTAGVGHALLRLHDSSLEPLLLVSTG